MADESLPEPETPDAVTERLDPGRLKDAHGRTGRMLKNAGLPFEEEEFEDGDTADADADSTSASSEDSSEE